MITMMITMIIMIITMEITIMLTMITMIITMKLEPKTFYTYSIFENIVFLFCVLSTSQYTVALAVISPGPTVCLYQFAVFDSLVLMETLWVH